MFVSYRFQRKKQSKNFLLITQARWSIYTFKSLFKRGRGPSPAQSLSSLLEWNPGACVLLLNCCARPETI